MEDGSIVVPGNYLGSTVQLLGSVGTHSEQDKVYASVTGISSITAIPNPDRKGPRQSISVKPGHSLHSNTNNSANNVLPAVDSIVLARVTRINPRQATVSIVVVSGTVCPHAGPGGEGFQGLIRVQDVRAVEKDKVKIIESFRPGDVVRAAVISLGDQSNYYLSTARNELGVVLATSEVGNAMFPVSWREFMDPITGQKELRKAAKPV